MKSFKYRNLILLCSIFIISSCSSMDGLRFWKSDEIDPDEPKKLVAFSNQKNIVIQWKNSFKGENETVRSDDIYTCLLYTSPSPRDG